jgi:hypothetical protein
MRRYSAKLRLAGNLPVEARVGVNTGEVVVREIRSQAGSREKPTTGEQKACSANPYSPIHSGEFAVG